MKVHTDRRGRAWSFDSWGKCLDEMPLSGIVLAIGILLGITTLVGIIGNVAVCLVVFWNCSMRSQLHLLLLNLAIADVGMSASCMPFAVATVLFHEQVCLLISQFLEFLPYSCEASCK